MINITNIVVGVIKLLVAVAIAIIIPLIKEKFDSAKFGKVVTLAATAVKAAEQIFTESGMGKKKKEFVINYLKQKGCKIDDNELDVVIESAVLELKHAISA